MKHRHITSTLSALLLYLYYGLHKHFKKMVVIVSYHPMYAKYHHNMNTSDRLISHSIDLEWFEEYITLLDLVIEY